MKKFMGLPLLALAFTLLVPAAQADEHVAQSPTEGTPVECYPDHVTGKVTGELVPCQSADEDPSDSACQVMRWVGKATCTLSVPEGKTATGVASTLTWAHAEAQADRFYAEINLKITDLSTNQVIHQSSGTNVQKYEDSPWPWPAIFGPIKARPEDGGVAVTGGGPFLCEVTGTHSALAARPNMPIAPSAPYNRLRCLVHSS